ncbi:MULTISPECIES: hypothetical protein [Streptomyces]|uniref:Uncharacterized protein n=1 Tax=Streptomyces dengpaensis TaxID=2049881 RepID=A0ABN5I5P7_9ACTN|nr:MULTISPECIES: hypothetical protein [Streptomyces]AVH58383.1 hypothetical protein C4B68_24380 [Streptomyces dengpaensis]PIB06058.1 hypothetical protein B1C81_26100 [Streptomyces sp. HG99]
MRVPGYLLRHRITVEPYLGVSAYGPRYGPKVEDVPALVDETIKRVRDATGAEVTSTAQIIAAPDLNCPTGSRITLPDGRTTTALTVAHHTAPGLPVPASTEVSCE